MLHRFWTLYIRKYFKIASLVQKLRRSQMCGFFLVVELHRKGSAINGATPSNLFSKNAVHRTALATPGLLITAIQVIISARHNVAKGNIVAYPKSLSPRYFLICYFQAFPKVWVYSVKTGPILVQQGSVLRDPNRCQSIPTAGAGVGSTAFPDRLETWISARQWNIGSWGTLGGSLRGCARPAAASTL